MTISDVVTQIDAEIAKLQQARALLTGTTSGGRVGRPKGSKNAKAPKKRTLSAAGRKRIADAMKKRWADKRKEKKAAA